MGKLYSSSSCCGVYCETSLHRGLRLENFTLQNFFSNPVHVPGTHTNKQTELSQVQA